MRTAFWLVIVALAFGLGVGAGALILPADSKPPTTIGDSSEAAEQPNKPQTALPADLPREELVRPGAPRPDFPTSSDDPLLQVLKGLEFEQVKTVEGSITASVTDEDGKPMAGIELRLYPSFPHERQNRPYNYYGSEEEFWESVHNGLSKQAESVIRMWRNKLTATTDVEGRVEFSPLLNVAYSMRFAEEGLGIKPDREPYWIKPGDHVNWGFPARSVVRVTVEPCTGVSSLRINATAPPQGVDNHAENGAKPGESVEFKLRSGTWEISASANKGSLITDVVRVEVEDNGPPQEVTLRLRPVARIRVELIYAGGTPSSGANVWYAPVRADLNDEDHFDTRRNLAVVMQNAAGWHHATGLEPGDYIVRAGVQGFVQTRRIAAVAGENVVQFEFNAPAASEGIECVVEYPEGTERPRFYFEAEIQYAKTSDHLHHDRVHDFWQLAENSYLLTDLWRRENTRVVAVSVNCPGLGEQRREVTRGKGEVLRFRFESPATLKVAVQDIPQNLGKYVSVRVGEKSEYMWNDTVSFDGMQPGTMDVTLRYSRLDQFVLARTTCNLRAGETREISLTMPPMFELVIEADRGEYSLSTITLQEDETQSAHISQDRDGCCILPYIPAGTYTVIYYKRSTGKHKERTITVRSNTTVRIAD